MPDLANVLAGSVITQALLAKAAPLWVSQQAARHRVQHNDGPSYNYSGSVHRHFSERRRLIDRLSGWFAMDAAELSFSTQTFFRCGRHYSAKANRIGLLFHGGR